MADGGVAGQGLHPVGRLAVRSADKEPFRAPVLVAQGDFQVQDLLAEALKAEMTGLDDAGMHRSDPDLVDLVALDLVVLHVADQRMLRRVPAPGIAVAMPDPVKADRLQPGMALGHDPELFGHFPLEEMELGPAQGESRVTARQLAAHDVQFMGCRLTDDREDFQRLFAGGRLMGETGDNLAVRSAGSR